MQVEKVQLESGDIVDVANVKWIAIDASTGQHLSDETLARQVDERALAEVGTRCCECLVDLRTPYDHRAYCPTCSPLFGNATVLPLEAPEPRAWERMIETPDVDARRERGWCANLWMGADPDDDVEHPIREEAIRLWKERWLSRERAKLNPPPPSPPIEAGELVELAKKPMGWANLSDVQKRAPVVGDFVEVRRLPGDPWLRLVVSRVTESDEHPEEFDAGGFTYLARWENVGTGVTGKWAWRWPACP